MAINKRHCPNCGEPYVVGLPCNFCGERYTPCLTCGNDIKKGEPCSACGRRYDQCQRSPVNSTIVRDSGLRTKAFEKLKGYVAKETIIDNLKWHRRFIQLCTVNAQWSKDPSTKCGCVIVDDKQRIVSMGYNGPPRGIKDSKERLNDRAVKYDLTIHAELNAILFANRNLEGCTLYNIPMAPCIRCAVHIIQTGITTVCFPKLPEDLVERWGESVALSKVMFEEAGVEWIEI